MNYHGSLKQENETLKYIPEWNPNTEVRLIILDRCR